MTRYEEILKEENLGAKYQMKVIGFLNKSKSGFGDEMEYDELYFTSLTDFNFFLLSDHYGKITKYNDDRIIVTDLKSNEIVFDSANED